MGNYNIAAAFAPWIQAWAGTVANNGYKKGLGVAQDKLNSVGQATEEDQKKAFQQLLVEKGYADFIGKNPNQLVIDNKAGYAQAQAANDAEGMQRYHEQANKARELAQLLKFDMNGFGENDTLELSKGLMSKAMGQPASPANGLGDNLKYLGATKPQSTVSPEFQAEIAQIATNQNAQPKMFSEEAIRSNFTDEIAAKAGQFAAQRADDPRARDRLRVSLIKQGYDPRAVDSVFMQDERRRKTEKLESYISKFDSPQMQNFMRIALEDPNMAAFGANVGVTPKEQWGSDTKLKNTMAVMDKSSDNREKAAESNYVHTQADKDADVGRNKELISYNAGIQRMFNNVSAEDKIALVKKYPELSGMILGEKANPQAKPQDKKVTAKLSEYKVKAEQAVNANDLEASSAAINELVTEAEIKYANGEIDQTDYNSAMQAAYTYNAIRELMNGNTAVAMEKYMPYLPEDTRNALMKKYGVSGANAARLPRGDGVPSSQMKPQAAGPLTPNDRILVNRGIGNGTAAERSNAEVAAVEAAICGDGTLDYASLESQGINRTKADMIYAMKKARG